MKEIIVLIAHGSPPNDFPPRETAELFAVHGRLTAASGAERAGLEFRHHELDTKMRTWPRTPQNDPFWAASIELGQALARTSGRDVLVAFNEFCAPGIDETLDRAVAEGATSILVTTPMLTPGGEHAEQDIPRALGEARTRHPGVSIRYIWPFPVERVAAFLAENLGFPAPGKTG
jgi:sirohydrochlorin cobaltochelatase